MLGSLFNKVAGLRAFNFIETSAQMFSCEFWEIFKKICFYEHFRWQNRLNRSSRLNCLNRFYTSCCFCNSWILLEHRKIRLFNNSLRLSFDIEIYFVINMYHVLWSLMFSKIFFLFCFNQLTGFSYFARLILLLTLWNKFAKCKKLVKNLP